MEAAKFNSLLSPLHHSMTDFYHVHGDMPTVEEIKSVYDMPPEPKEPNEDAADAEKEQCQVDKARYDRKKTIFVWYLNEWLPWAAGLEHWGPEIRIQKLPTDTILLATGEEKVCVTCASEAYGLAVFENCHKKWKAGIPYMLENNKRSIPEWKKKKVETHKFYCKWTSKREGLRGGWSDDGIKAFNAYIAHIQAFRKADEEKDKVIQKLGRKFIREALEWDLDDGEPSSKRQKTGSDGTEGPEPEPISIVVLDE